jgi:RHS repeat-associated protein
MLFSNYSFNNQEHDDEVYGDGNAYSYDARMYDPRLGKWLSLDPLATKYAGISPYNFSFNNPIIFNDPDGKDGRLKVFTDQNGQVNITLETTVHLYGKDSKGQAAYMNKAYHDAGFDKTRTFKMKDANGKETTYNVTIKVSYDETNSQVLDAAAKAGGYNDPTKDKYSDPKRYASADDLKAQDLPTFKAGDNVLEIDMNKDWGVGGAVDGNGGVVGKNSSDKTKIHEPFHFLGVPEGYITFQVDGRTRSSDKKGLRSVDGKTDVMGGGDGTIYSQAGGEFYTDPDFHINAYHYYQIIQYSVDNKISGETVLKNERIEQDGEYDGEEFSQEVKKAENSEVKKQPAKKTGGK